MLMPFESGATSRVRQGVALDVGCAVGGASFELTRHFRDVVGVDLSASFIAAAKVLKERGRLTYKSLAEGETYVTKEARVNPKIDRTRVEFREGDACALPPSLLGGGGDFADAENFQNFGRHDAVLAANLLCRLPDPEAFLRDCATSRTCRSSSRSTTGSSSGGARTPRCGAGGNETQKRGSARLAAARDSGRLVRILSVTTFEGSKFFYAYIDYCFITVVCESTRLSS